MANVIPLSLRATPKTDPNRESLPFLISCINDQRGSFRYITEESLEDEIRAADDGQIDTLEGAAGEEDTQNVKSRQEDLAEARSDMLSQVQQALFESTGALSLLSLVLAGNSPHAANSQQALSTVDSYIQETLSRDAFAVDKLQTPQKSEAERQAENMIELGWKTQSLGSVADFLLNSATRLEKELASETRYWDQVLKIKDQGWPVTRLPREKHALGVRYGFAEAHADFRDRGLAALRRDEDGNTSLDRGLWFTGDRKLRVRVFQHDKVLSRNRLSMSALNDPDEAIDDDSVEGKILRARDSLFEEELHAEMHREARNLTNQGVSCIGDLIQLPYESDKFIQIDLIGIGDTASEDFQDEGTLPTAISMALQILLSHAHRQNLRRRARSPPPLTDSKAPRPVYQIIKPIMEHMRHRFNVQSCYDFVANITKTLAKGDLVVKVQHDTTALLNVPDDLGNILKDDVSATETLIGSLVAPPRSFITLHLPSGQSVIKIELLTNLFPPNFGTTYQSMIESTKPDSMTATLPNPVHFTSAADLQNHLTHALTVDLVDYIVASVTGWTMVDAHTGLLSRTIETSNIDLRSQSIRVNVETNRLALEWSHVVEDDENARDRQIGSWQSVTWSEGAANEKSLLDTIIDLTAIAS